MNNNIIRINLIMHLIYLCDVCRGVCMKKLDLVRDELSVEIDTECLCV